MLKTLDQVRDDLIFGAKVQMVTKTLTEVFGSTEMNVVFQAMANWIGMLVFNTNGNPYNRREIVRRFSEQVESTITAYEQGKLP